MLLGIQITPVLLVAGGLLLYLLIAFQVLQGARKIRFRGPLHMKVHRVTGYSILVLASVHAVSALAYFGVI